MDPETTRIYITDADVEDAFNELRRHLTAACAQPDGRFLLDDIETDILRILRGQIIITPAGDCVRLTF